MRRSRVKFIAAIAVVWIALTIGELWPFQRMFDVPPEYRLDVFFRDLSEGMRTDISPREAHLLWVIRDPEPADGTLAVFTSNFGKMLRRASPLELPVVVPLDLLALLFGDAYALIRLIAIVAAGLILATAAYFVVPPVAALFRRRLHKSARHTLIAGSIFSCTAILCSMSVIFPRACFFGESDKLSWGLRAYLGEYAAGDSVITIFDADSRFAHFTATQDLHLGNHIDLSQREFSATEIEAIIGGIDADRVWVLFERGEPQLVRNFDAVLEALEASGRGFPFLRGPTTRFGAYMDGPLTPGSISERELSDYWSIRGYDANSDVLWHRMVDIPRCWGF